MPTQPLLVWERSETASQSELLGYEELAPCGPGSSPPSPELSSLNRPPDIADSSSSLPPFVAICACFSRSECTMYNPSNSGRDAGLVRTNSCTTPNLPRLRCHPPRRHWNPAHTRALRTLRTGWLQTNGRSRPPHTCSPGKRFRWSVTGQPAEIRRHSKSVLATRHPHGPPPTPAALQAPILLFLLVVS